MSAALVRGLTHLVFWSGVGYVLLKVVTPSDEEMRKVRESLIHQLSRTDQAEIANSNNRNIMS